LILENIQKDDGRAGPTIGGALENHVEIKEVLRQILHQEAAGIV
jgi:hypothetical protein